jgi:hypothetical protein
MQGLICNVVIELHLSGSTQASGKSKTNIGHSSIKSVGFVMLAARHRAMEYIGFVMLAAGVVAGLLVGFLVGWCACAVAGTMNHKQGG